MKFFLAGIMQGSLVEPELHDQDYRPHLKKLLLEQFPDAEVYDPLEKHSGSINYDDTTGRMVFFNHNIMCRDVDVLIAFVPEASMGTAIEMWEAYQHTAIVLTISPLTVNWAVKFLSHAIYPDLEAFESALASGEVLKLIEEVLAKKRGPKNINHPPHDPSAWILARIAETAWLVKFLRHTIYPDLEAFESMVVSGEVRKLMENHDS